MPEKELLRLSEDRLRTGSQTVEGVYQRLADATISLPDQAVVTDYCRDLNRSQSLAHAPEIMRHSR
jgi:hypothetical protein